MLTHHVIALGLAVGVVAPAAYVAFDREPCVTVRSAELLTPVVRPGDDIRVRLVVDRHAVCEYHRTSFLKDGANTVTPYAPVDLAATGEVKDGDVVDFAETVPASATPGTAEYWRWGYYRRSLANDYWPLPPVLLAHFQLTVLESQNTQRIGEIMRLLDLAADEQDGRP